MLVQLISCPYGLFCSCVQWHIQPITPDLLDHLAVHQGKYIVSLLKWHKHCSIYVFELSCDVANICGTIFHSLHDNCAPYYFRVLCFSLNLNGIVMKTRNLTVNNFIMVISAYNKAPCNWMAS
jgi:hypothetical protein